MALRGSVLIRVDGNSLIGYGHVVRCIALAEILKDDFDVEFAVISPDAFIRERITPVAKLNVLPQQDFFLPDDPRSTRSLSFDIADYIERFDIVVTDGYRFHAAYRERVKTAGKALVTIDDHPAGYYVSDLIINPTPLWEDYPISKSGGSVYCGGLKYATLRRRFIDHPLSSRNREGFLIVMGGTDYFGLTLKFAEYLVDSSASFIHAVITDGFQPDHLKELVKLERTRGERVKLHRNVSTVQMVGLMDSVATGVGPCSGAMLEMMSRKLPAGFGYYAENQRSYYNYFKIKKWGYDLGDMKGITLKKINQFVAACSTFEAEEGFDQIRRASGNLLKVFIAL